MDPSIAPNPSSPSQTQMLTQETTTIYHRTTIKPLNPSQIRGMCHRPHTNLHHHHGAADLAAPYFLLLFCSTASLSHRTYPFTYPFFDTTLSFAYLLSFSVWWEYKHDDLIQARYILPLHLTCSRVCIPFSHLGRWLRIYDTATE